MLHILLNGIDVTEVRKSHHQAQKDEKLNNMIPKCLIAYRLLASHFLLNTEEREFHKNE